MLHRAAGITEGLLELAQCPTYRSGGSQRLGRVNHGGDSAAGLAEAHVRSGYEGASVAGSSKETPPVFRVSIVCHGKSASPLHCKRPAKATGGAAHTRPYRSGK